jgi:hypothetical protein
MRNHLLLTICVAALALPLAACNEPSDTAVAEQTFGPSPTLPPPQSSLIPTTHLAAILRSRALARRLEGSPLAFAFILRGSPKTASTSG